MRREPFGRLNIASAQRIGGIVLAKRKLNIPEGKMEAALGFFTKLITFFKANPAILISAMAFLFTVIASIIGLRFTNKQIEMSRKHNYLSVKPYVKFIGYYAQSGSEPIGLSIKNNGLGPAIIKKINYIWENTPVQGQSNLRKIWNEHFKKEDSLVFTNIEPEATIGANEEQWLFKIEGDKKAEGIGKKFLKFAQSLNIEIEYECFYGKTKVKEILQK